MTKHNRVVSLHFRWQEMGVDVGWGKDDLVPPQNRFYDPVCDISIPLCRYTYPNSDMFWITILTIKLQSHS